MITKTKRIFAGLLLAGMIVTQAEASWFNDAWNIIRNRFTSALSTTKKGIAKHPLISASALIAPIASIILFRAARRLHNRWKPVPFQMPELDDDYTDNEYDTSSEEDNSDMSVPYFAPFEGDMPDSHDLFSKDSRGKTARKNAQKHQLR